MEFRIGALDRSARELEVEVAEHKGPGHPDTICDALAERLSVALCRHYLDRFGAILHHNVDKALLWGGAARPAFGGGEVISPIEIYLAGRATREVEGAVVPVEELVETSAREHLRRSLHALDPDRHVRLHCLVRPGSSDLVDVYRRGHATGAWLANDTSIGAGYAPLSELEAAVLSAARELGRMSKDPASPEVGEDVKVMGVRRGACVQLTVSCALIGAHLANIHHYTERRAAVAARVLAAAREVTSMEVEVEVNAGDDLDSGAVYLTVTGTSAEAGDDGQVGRGNRINGLITPMRPMTLEAAAGKNPVTHVGKLYSLAAHEIARDVVAQLDAVTEAHCHLVSRIGHPISEPQIAYVRVRAREGVRVEALGDPVQAIVRDHLGRIDHLAARLIAGELTVY